MFFPRWVSAHSADRYSLKFIQEVGVDSIGITELARCLVEGAAITIPLHEVLAHGAVEDRAISKIQHFNGVDCMRVPCNRLSS